MNKCYKCGGKIAVVSNITITYQTGEKSYTTYYNKNMCLPCVYLKDEYIAKEIMPFTAYSLELIRQGKKRTSLRSLKYNKYPFRKKKVYIHTLEDYKNMDIEHPTQFGVFMEDPFSIFRTIETNSVVKSEGFKTFDELITALEKRGFKLPQKFFLYDLRKPIGE